MERSFWNNSFINIAPDQSSARCAPAGFLFLRGPKSCNVRILLEIGETMFWDEKIDRLKARLPNEQFRAPFSDWVEILKKIEGKFINKGWPPYHFSNWSNNLKPEVLVRNISKQEIEGEVSKLDNSVNYWAVIVLQNGPTAKHYVYDCSTDALKMLLAIAPCDFYIGSKKYEWLIYFKVGDKEIR